MLEADGHVNKPLITLLTGWSERHGANSGLGDTEAKPLLKNWMGELAIVHAHGLARCLNSRAARCVYETAVRNGKARGHALPPSLREIALAARDRRVLPAWGMLVGDKELTPRRLKGPRTHHRVRHKLRQPIVKM